ncbi:hypothetical protein GGI12_005513 [Dipsacomyces acuminosporus]|nr:hypothetical protein GGI12_005513 [Dipsacomyces acuminosporus]
MCIFSLTFCLTATLLPADRTIKYMPELEVCKYADGLQHTCLAATCTFWLLYTVSIILIRNIRSSFNELRESIIVYATGSTMIIVITVLHIVQPKFPLRRNTRIASLVTDMVFICSPIWLLLAKPTYMCFFHYDEYLKKWQQKLVDDGLAKQYELQDGESSASGRNYSRMEDSV